MGENRHGRRQRQCRHVNQCRDNRGKGSHNKTGRQVIHSSEGGWGIGNGKFFLKMDPGCVAGGDGLWGKQEHQKYYLNLLKIQGKNWGMAVLEIAQRCKVNGYRTVL